MYIVIATETVQDDLLYCLFAHLLTFMCNGQYQLACTSAGGKLDTVDSLNIECNAEMRGGGGEIQVIMHTMNMPDCLGKSCDGKLKDYIENNDFQQELAKELEDMFTCKCHYSFYLQSWLEFD